MQYIVLDLETTGTDPKKDQIIECSAVKIKDGKITDTFDSLVNPQTKISSFITSLTGITNEDLATASPWSDIKDKVQDFLGELPIVGHNIAFDISFLKKQKIDLSHNTSYDTYELSGILLPYENSHSLEGLVRSYQLEGKATHRALDDVKATHKLFELLLGIIQRIDKKTLLDIQSLIARSPWTSGVLFDPQVLAQLHTADLTDIQLKKPPRLPTLHEERSDLEWDESKIKKALGTKGAITQIEHFQPREAQQQMSLLINQSFQNLQYSCIEAETGIGKTLAYLLPALYCARSTGKPVVISTFTKNLQSQILSKDIQILQKIVDHIEGHPVKFNISTLKGKKNYLCSRKLHAFLQQEKFTSIEVRFLIKILLWSQETETGDFSEVAFIRGERPMQYSVCVESGQALFSKCRDNEKCFIKSAREKARQSDIIIVNHSLLLNDALLSSSMMPSFSHVVIDEAHHLEQVATDVFGTTLTHEQIISSLQTFTRAKFDFLKTSKPSQNIQKQLDLISSEVTSTISRIDILFSIIGMLREKFYNPKNSFNQKIGIDQSFQNTDLYLKMRKSASNCALSFTQIKEAIVDFETSLADEIITYRGGQSFLDELRELATLCLKYIDNLKLTIIEPKEETVSWITLSNNERVYISTAPLFVGPQLETALYDKLDSIILTSATLTIANSFNYIRAQLKLDDTWQFANFHSPFDYASKVLLVIPSDAPEPSHHGSQRYNASAISDAVIATGGRTLALFTSYSSIETTYRDISLGLQEHHISLLAQILTGSKEKILHAFLEHPKTHALLGAASFWEGVDIPGPDLSCLIITRLPFEPPNDPVLQARSRLFDNPFSEFSLPRAVLRFRQGFGRLIRSEKDYGVVIVLDGRILKKNYGSSFLDSLPQMTQVSPDLPHIAQEVKKFLAS